MANGRGRASKNRHENYCTCTLYFETSIASCVEVRRVRLSNKHQQAEEKDDKGIKGQDGTSYMNILRLTLSLSAWRSMSTLFSTYGTSSYTGFTWCRGCSSNYFTVNC